MKNNKMKLLMTFIFAVALISTASAASIKVIVNDVSPQPVEPGSDLTVRVTFTNGDSDFVNSVSARLDLREPFTLKTSTENFEDGFSLCAFCSRTNTYFINVDTSAKSGVYPIFVRTDGTVRTINVTIRGQPNIVLVSSLINATPSDVFLMSLDARNIGTGIASQIKVMSKSADFIVLGSSIATLGSVAPQNSSKISFMMTPKEDIDAGAYNIPFEISYRDEAGAQYNSTQTIGVRVLNKGELNIENIKVSSAVGRPTAGSPLTVIVRLENVGTGNANSIQSELECDGQKATAYLGQLKRDEDAPAVFELTLPSGGKRQCTLTTNFADDSGAHRVTNSFDISLNNPELPIVPIIVLVIIAGIYYNFRIRKKQR